MAQGNAFVADASDASAIFYNPAGLNQLKRPEVYLGSFLNYPAREFHSPGGDFAQTNHRLYRSLTVYFAAPVTPRVALGVGVFTPFGMGTVWPQSWAGRYLATYSNLKTYNLNPVLSVKLLDNLSVAAGFNVLWSTIRVKGKIPLGPLPDGESDLGGDGVGYGYNLGLLYEPVSGVKLGVAYRSEIFVNHWGDYSTTLPTPLPAVPRINGSAPLTYPPSVTFGASYARFQPFAFEVDVTWTGWSTYDRLEVNLEQPMLVNGVLTKTLVNPKNWRDAWAFRFGANYEIKEGMKLRAGYIYDLTPVPGDTLDPQVPDANRHIFTVGGDLKYKRFTLGIAYNYILSESRDKNNALGINGVPVPAAYQANGRYQSNVHSLATSISFQF